MKLANWPNPLPKRSRNIATKSTPFSLDKAANQARRLLAKMHAPLGLSRFLHCRRDSLREPASAHCERDRAHVTHRLFERDHDAGIVEATFRRHARSNP